MIYFLNLFFVVCTRVRYVVRLITINEKENLFLFPCDENRGKIDDLIAIFGPINCALYRDRIDQFDEF